MRIPAPEADADVVVVGLGAMGSHALWRLARRGARVIGIEQFAPGHDRGASHGESRIIRTAYAEGAAYVPLALEAWRLWDELERVAGEELVQRTGGLVLGAPGSPVVGGAVASAAAHGLEHEILSTFQVRQRFPQHRVDDGTIGFYEEDAGVVRPERAVVAAVRAARAAGARLVTGERVHQIVPDPDRPVVRLPGRDVVAGHVVVAAGAWLPRLAPGLDLPLQVVRRVPGWFAATSPEAFSTARFPIFIRSDPSGERSWYGCPSLDGATVKVATHDWPGTDEPVDPVVGPRPPDEADAALTGSIVAASLPGLRPRPVRMKPCTYALTPDRHFVVGRRRDLPGLTVLAGFSGHGFKFAPVIGEAAAQLALTGRTDLPVELFDPHRFDRVQHP